MKLYELEDCLPAYFCRVSKSTIANARAVYSLDKSFSGTSRISFHKTHKEVHVSRHYYHLLKRKITRSEVGKMKRHIIGYLVIGLAV